MNLRLLLWVRHTELFFREASAEFSGDGMLFNSIRGDPWELQLGVEREVVSRVQLDVRAAIPERHAPPPTVGEQLPRRVYSRRSVELASHGYTDRCIGCQLARLGLKVADHSEECRARIVRHMTADEDLNQRVQFAQDRTVEVAPLEARTGERDSVPEPARKVRFVERVEEKTPEDTVVTNSRCTSSSSSRSPSSDPSSSPTAIDTSMQVDECNQDSSERQKVTMVLMWNWKGWSWSLSGIVFNDDCDFLMQVKHNADVFLDRSFSNDHRKREKL